METLQTPQHNTKPWLMSGAFLALAILIGFGIFKISGSFLATRAPSDIALSDTVIGGDLKGEGLPAGTYTLKFLAKTQDGTLLSDAFTFTIGASGAYGPGPDPTVDPYGPLPDPYGPTPTPNPPLPYGPTPVPFPSVTPGPYAPALVAYWKFDEGVSNPAKGSSTLLTDSSGNKRTASLYDRLFTTGRWELTDKPLLNFGNISALKFDGTSDYVQLPALIGVTPATYVQAFSAWVKTTGTGTQVLAVGTEASNSTYKNLYSNAILLDGGYLTIRNTGAQACTSSVKVNDGKWHHVAASVGSLNTVTYYVDGVEARTCTYPTRTSSQVNTSSGALFVNSSPYWVGMDYDQTKYFKGSLDDVRFYREALAADHVKRLAEGNEL